MNIFDRVLHVAYIAKAYRSAVFVSDNQLAILIGAEDLVIRANCPCIDRISHLAFGTIRVRRTQSCSHRIQPDAEFVEQGRIHFRADRRTRTATDIHLADSIYLREFLRQDRVSSVIHFGQGHDVRGECQDQHRCVGRIDFAVPRIPRQIRGKLAAGGIDCSLDVATSGVDVAIQIELQNDVR